MPPDSPLDDRSTHEQLGHAMRGGWVEGSSFFGSVMAGFVLGWGGDWLLGTDPWLVVSGIIAGSVWGFYRLFLWTKKQNEEDLARRGR